MMKLKFRNLKCDQSAQIACVAVLLTFPIVDLLIGPWVFIIMGITGMFAISGVWFFIPNW